MGFQPGAEQRRDFMRQADQDVIDVLRAGHGKPRHHLFDLMIVDRRDDRRHVGRYRHAGFGQASDRGDPPFGMGRARLQRARDLGIERGDRNHHRDQIVARQIGKQVDVAQDAVGLGGDEDRMAAFHHHLQQLAGDPPILLDRLIGIGIRAHGDRRDAVVPVRQFLAQQCRCIRLGEQARLEVEPRRQVMIGVGRAGKAIDAAMLAAGIGVDRLGEGDIGRRVARYDRARRNQRDAGAQFLGRSVDRFHGVEPVAVRLARGQVEPAACLVVRCAASGNVCHLEIRTYHELIDKVASDASWLPP